MMASMFRPGAFYGPQYSRFGSDLAIELRREVYGEDLGQQGWRSLAEQADIARLLRLDPGGHLLDIASGSGGPSLDLAARSGCRITGVELEPGAVAYARDLAASRGLTERATFAVQDAAAALPFADGAFDWLLCVDAVSHLGERFARLADWARLLAPGGLLLFSDPVVLTGGISASEIEVRASTGPLLLVPPGLNERAIATAGLRLMLCEDRSEAVATLAARWHAARVRRAERLQADEGADWFAQRQRFLATTAVLAAEGRLSRFLYVAEKPAPSNEGRPNR
jgi:cyclopropane fatty-acyl-phospholipid synthase-like methyltransferase